MAFRIRYNGERANFVAYFIIYVRNNYVLFKNKTTAAPNGVHGPFQPETNQSI